MTQVGDLVIFGESDAPEAHCIGRITKREGNIWHGSYLSKRTRERYNGDLCDTMVTPVEAFGVRASISGKKMTVTSAGESVARYSDNKARKWQETLPRTISL